MKTMIYLIRHGESMANARDAFIGQTDLDLTEKGHSQAEKTSEYLKNIHADVIYSSDLIRAYHTAEHTAIKKNMHIIKSKNLREMDGGEWENKTYGEIQNKFRESYYVFKTDISNFRCDGGESIYELCDRFEKEVKRIVNDNIGKTIFIFTHATPIRTIATKWGYEDISEMKNLAWPTNASVTLCSEENGKYTLEKYSMDYFQK